MCIKLCKPKKVKIKDGRTILIRRPRMSDLKELRDYVNSLVDENAPIEMTKRISLKGEREWLKSTLKKVRKGDSHVLVAELDKKVVSAVHLDKGRGRTSHVGEAGIAVRKGYRRLGIATIMLSNVIQIGKKDKSIKIITLRVYEYNKRAQGLYRKLGFRKVAKLKNRVKFDGKLGNMFVLDYKG